MVDGVLLTELRQLYDLQLQAGRQGRWQTERELSLLCMIILNEIDSGALDSLYDVARPAFVSPLPQALPAIAQCA